MKKIINCYPYCGPRDSNSEICKSCKPYKAALNKRLKQVIVDREKTLITILESRFNRRKND